MSEYGAVKGGKLRLKGGAGSDYKKKKKKKTKRKREEGNGEETALRHGQFALVDLIPLI